LKLLAIESAFEACSAALWLDGACLERFAPGPRAHAENLLPFVHDLLDESATPLSGLDGIVFSRGPGSFTSLRIGIGVVQGLAWGADLPVVPVSSLRCVAQSAVGMGVTHAWVTMDARMNEVFSACFAVTDGVMHAVNEESVCAPQSAIPDESVLWSAVGNGIGRFEKLGRVPVKDRWPDLIARAAHLVPLALSDWAQGLALPAEQAQPVYLRNQVADKPKPN